MKKYLQALQAQLPLEEMERLLEIDPTLCVAIKSREEGYVYANRNFLTLMGFADLNMIINKKDKDICSDKELSALYAEYDEHVYSTGKSMSFRANIQPSTSPRTLKMMEGIVIPLYLTRIKPEAVAIIIKPQNQLLALGIDQLCILPFATLQSVLTRRKYSIQLPAFNKSLARMEILCFAQLLKGKHAGEIAESLGIKQVTVESYISNLKNKCGVNTKGELIAFLAENRILETIIV